MSFKDHMNSVKAKRLTPLRWSEVFLSSASVLLSKIFALAEFTDDPLSILFYYMAEAPDPNASRTHLMDRWTEVPDFQF